MKLLYILLLVFTCIFFSNCKDPCFDDMRGWGSGTDYKYMVVVIQKNNQPVSFDSVYVINPTLMAVALNKVPVNYAANNIILTLKQANQPWDTLHIRYNVNVDYNSECDEAYFSVSNFVAEQSTFDATYWIRFNNLYRQ